jgi:DNA-binding transcriptional LysR family regulator
MEFHDLRAFVSVADTGSVSRAAVQLSVTQSAVSRRIQRLETTIGTSLLDRRTRPVSLTGTGQVVLERCRRLLNDFREVHAAANNHFAMSEIRIGVAHALTEVALTEPIERVRRKFPKVALRLRTGWSHDLLERVRAGTLDAALIFLPEGEHLPGEIVGKALGQERLLIIAAKRGASFHPRNLSGANWILNPEGCAARATLRQKLLRSNIEMTVAVETYNYDLQLALVARNRGLSLVPERILTRSRMKSSLRVVRLPGFDFPLTVWLLRREPCTSLEAVIEQLGQALMEKL